MKRIWNVRRDQRGTTHFKFDREDALRWFMAEIYQWPQVFRSFQDYYDIGEKIGACKVYKALIYLEKYSKVQGARWRQSEPGPRGSRSIVDRSTRLPVQYYLSFYTAARTAWDLRSLLDSFRVGWFWEDCSVQVGTLVLTGAFGGTATMNAMRKMRKRLKEEGLVIKAEEVTNMAKNNKKTKGKILKLCELCEENENAHVIFSVFRARLSDGIRNGHHLSLIKTIWLMDTMAKHGHQNMVEFIASALPYLEGVASFYATQSEAVDTEAFRMVMQKACELADYLQTREAAESPRKGPQKNISDAVDEYLTSVENVLSDIATKLVLKVNNRGKALDSELVSPPDTPRTPRSWAGNTLNETFGSQRSTPGSTPANSFTTLLRPS